MTQNSPFDRTYQAPASTRDASGDKVDQGLRAYMLSVYNYMALGLGITGVVAFLTASSPAMMDAIFGTPLRWVVLFAPLGFVFFISARIERMQASTAQMLFWTYSGINGFCFAILLHVYEGSSIARVFFISAGMFAAMSLYGYTTRKDLSGVGSFCFMGLIGVIIASIVNIFIASSVMHFAISIIGVLVFVGLTAYDTQKIKGMYYAADSGEVSTKKAVLGALTLYLDFINLFLFLLRLLGNRR
ncbi:MAG: Bax inhibitor-1/YccA family protein [Pseudomonadota bacterium]